MRWVGDWVSPSGQLLLLAIENPWTALGRPFISFPAKTGVLTVGCFQSGVVYSGQKWINGGTGPNKVFVAGQI